MSALPQNIAVMKRFWELPAFFRILVIVVILFHLQEVIGQIDYTEMDLEEDLTHPTETSSRCEAKKRSAKRSLNESLQEQDIIDIPDDCIAYVNQCPKQVRISWLQAAPYVYDASKFKNNSDQDINGIVHDVVKRAIAICCKTFAGQVPQLHFLDETSNLKVLHRHLTQGEADMIIPVHSIYEKYGGSWPYVKILDSPGVVVIVPQTSVKEWKLVLKAVLGNWPVVLMALLLSSVAGIFIWALDSSQNPEEFPHRFHRGAFEGFWWAIVTITTIGYGDKTPKSVYARLFAVVWILIGVTVCSVMTASLTGALTSVQFEKYDITTGKQIGVLRDSVALQEAVNLAANITILEDQGTMFDSLTNGEGIDGIMEDIFIAVEFLKTNDKSKRTSIAKFIGHNRGFGVAYRKGLFEEETSNCLSNVIKFRYSDVLKITSDYIKAVVSATEGRVMFTDRKSDPIKVFDPKSPVFLACVVTLSGILLICLIGAGVGVLLTRRLNSNQLKGTDREKSTSKGIEYQGAELFSTIGSDEQKPTQI